MRCSHLYTRIQNILQQKNYQKKGNRNNQEKPLLNNEKLFNKSRRKKRKIKQPKKIPKSMQYMWVSFSYEL